MRVSMVQTGEVHPLTLAHKVKCCRLLFAKDIHLEAAGIILIESLENVAVHKITKGIQD